MIEQWNVAVAALFGAVIGSFLNVCIYRLPAGESLVRPGSRCPQCKAPIAWHDNVPILSYLWLRGRCRSCRARIAWRYPLVEALNAAGYGFIAWRFGATVTAFVYVLLFSALIVVSFIDLDHMIIPNAITYPGMVLGLISGMMILPRWWESISGFLLGGGYLYFMVVISPYLFKKEGMGEGDVKLLAMIGAIVGWKLVIVIIILAASLGSIVGLTLIAMRKLGRHQPIPFGPYLCVGAVVAMLYGTEILAWYGSFLSERR
jgi:leader peptidase (prepilin peptidase)/N-methyltransferase